MLSIIIPVTAQDVDSCKNLLKQLEKKHGQNEIIVVSPRQELQQTQQSLKEFSCLVIGAHQGRGYLLNAGAKKATQEFLLFLRPDSDIEPLHFIVLYQEMTLHRNKYEDYTMSFLLRYASKHPYMRFVEMTTVLWQRYMGAFSSEQGLLVPKKTLRKLKGWPARSAFLYFSFAQKAKRFKHCVSTQKILASDADFVKHGRFYTHLVHTLALIALLSKRPKKAHRLLKKIS
jgi:hypothetical protein